MLVLGFEKGLLVMNDTQLAYFIAVYDHGGYSAAANAMFTSRQVLGRSVVELEREIGGKLFVRKGRGIEPTLLGVKAAKIARVILSDMDHLKNMAAAEVSQQEGQRPFSIAISVHGLRGISFSPQALQLFIQTEFPDTPVLIEELTCESCYGALEAKLADAAIMLGSIDNKHYISEPVGSRDAYLAVSMTNPLAARSSVGIKDLEGVQLAQPESLSYVLPYVNEKCAALGFTPNWRYGGSDDRSMLRFIEEGGAVIMFKNSPLAMGADNLVLVPFKKNAKMRLPFCCVYQKDLDLESKDDVIAKLKEFFL